MIYYFYDEIINEPSIILIIAFIKKIKSVFFTMELKPDETRQVELTTEENSDVDISSRVLLFNDDWHTFEEVITQLIIATQCSFEQARGLAFEVHVKGKAIVFNGSMSACLKVSSVLEEIALHTQILT